MANPHQFQHPTPTSFDWHTITKQFDGIVEFVTLFNAARLPG
jgi:hypothetical protein